MADKKSVLVKVLDTKSVLDLNATFTSEVKSARNVRLKLPRYKYSQTHSYVDSIATLAIGSGNDTLRWFELYRPCCKLTPHAATHMI